MTHAPGIIFTVVRNEWLVHNLCGATWKVSIVKEFQRKFDVV